MQYGRGEFIQNHGLIVKLMKKLKQVNF